MSPRRFQLYLYWFRFQIAVRTTVRAARKQLPLAVPQIVAGLRWTCRVWLAPLWIFFVLAIGFWERLEEGLQGRYHLRTWQRGFYCLGLATGIGFAITLLKGWEVNQLVLLLIGTAGLLLFLAWRDGARWLGKILGVRPMRSMNPEEPYAGLNFKK